MRMSIFYAATTFTFSISAFFFFSFSHIVYLVQKISLKFIAFAESVQNQQKTVDFFSIKVYFKIKIWIQNQISNIINHKNEIKITAIQISYQDAETGVAFIR